MNRFVITFIAVALGQIAATSAWADLAQDRLSWGPQEYLKAGFRSVPWVRDPFFPETRKFVLKGIISSELAYINNRWLQQGDKLEGYRVKEIGTKSVVLVKQAEVVVLTIEEGGTK